MPMTDDLDNFPEPTHSRRTYDEVGFHATVIMSCNNQHASINEGRFLDIEEDIAGRDLLTYRCPICGLTHKSLIFG